MGEAVAASGDAARKASRVSDVVWNWRKPEGAKPDAGRAVRRKAVTQFGVMLVVAGLLWFWAKARITPAVILGFGCFLVASGFWFPVVFAAVDRFMHGVGTAFGMALTWILLVPFFCLVFVPARLLLLLSRMDPMKRRFPSAETTYWVPYHPAGPAEHYGKQYR